MEKKSFLAIYTVFSLFTTATAIPLVNFYSFGTGAGDSSVGPTLDGSSPAIILSEPFPFFTEDHSTIFVSNSYHE